MGFWRSVFTYGLASAFLGSLLHIANLGWTHFLSPRDYGRFANLEVIFGFSVALLTFAQHQYHVVFANQVDGRTALAERAGGFVLASMGLGGLLGLTVLLVPAAFIEQLLGPGIPRWALSSVVLAGAFSVGRLVAQGVHESQGHAVRASLWSEAVDGSRPLIAIMVFLWLSWTWEARWIGLVAAHILASGWAIWRLLRSGWVRLPTRRTDFVSSFGFVLPAVVSGVSYIVYDSIDRLFLTAYVGLEAVGRYHVAYKLAALALTVNVVMLRSFTPLYYAAHHRGEHEEAKRLIYRTARWTAGGVLAVAAILPLVLLLVPALGSAYTSTLTTIPIVVVGFGFLGVSNFFQAVLYARSRIKSLLVVALGTAASNAALNWALVPRYQEVGAAVATLASFALMLLSTWTLALRAMRADRVR